jgi:plastocyanin
MHELNRLLAVATVTCVLAACGPGDKNANSAGGNSTSTTTPTPASSTATAAPAAPAGGATSAAASTAGAPITGKTVKVQMVGDQQGYRFVPAKITIKVGDGVTWVNVSGGPHNATFWADSIPAGAQAVLQANMPNTMAPLTGPLLTNPNETYTVSFAGAKPGVYHFYCTPHLALGMTGVLTVQ